jgi:hypothetical protein
VSSRSIISTRCQVEKAKGIRHLEEALALADGTGMAQTEFLIERVLEATRACLSAVARKRTNSRSSRYVR